RLALGRGRHRGHGALRERQGRLQELRQSRRQGEVTGQTKRAPEAPFEKSLARISCSRAAGRLRTAPGLARQGPTEGCTRACLPASCAIAAAFPYRLQGERADRERQQWPCQRRPALSGKALLGLQLRRLHDALGIGNILREELAELLRVAGKRSAPWPASPSRTSGVAKVF